MLRTISVCFVIFSAIFVSRAAYAENNDGQLSVLATCGHSTGKGYFFRDQTFNPNGSSWMDDGISNGQITLVSIGEEVDILFGDAARSTGYVEDGARVILLHADERYIRVGAFSEAYADIYNFDRQSFEVAWSSNKSGPFFGKVAVYVAKCSFIK